VTRAAEQVLQLDETRLRLLDYIESRMNILAPNLTVVQEVIRAVGGIKEV